MCRGGEFSASIWFPIEWDEYSSENWRNERRVFVDAMHLTELLFTMVTAATIWASIDVSDANSTEIGAESVVMTTVAQKRLIVPNRRRWFGDTAVLFQPCCCVSWLLSVTLPLRLFSLRLQADYWLNLLSSPFLSVILARQFPWQRILIAFAAQLGFISSLNREVMAYPPSELTQIRWRTLALT